MSNPGLGLQAAYLGWNLSVRLLKEIQCLCVEGRGCVLRECVRACMSTLRCVELCPEAQGSQQVSAAGKHLRHQAPGGQQLGHARYLSCDPGRPGRWEGSSWCWSHCTLLWDGTSRVLLLARLLAGFWEADLCPRGTAVVAQS